MESQASLMGQYGVPGVVGCAGDGWGVGQGEWPDAFRTYGAAGEEIGVVKRVYTHGELALLSLVEVETAHVTTGAS